MQIQFNIVDIAIVIGALMTIGGFAAGILRFVKKSVALITQKETQKITVWLEAQQKDIEKSYEKFELLFDATYAILDWIIKEQNGNGPCHQAQKQMDSYIRKRAHEQFSYREK